MQRKKDLETDSYLECLLEIGRLLKESNYRKLPRRVRSVLRMAKEAQMLPQHRRRIRVLVETNAQLEDTVEAQAIKIEEMTINNETLRITNEAQANKIAAQQKEIEHLNVIAGLVRCARCGKPSTQIVEIRAEDRPVCGQVCEIALLNAWPN